MQFMPCSLLQFFRSDYALSRAQDEVGNPIKQDLKKGQLRFHPYNINWNYGLLPQTWEDPAHNHPELNYSVRRQLCEIPLVICGWVSVTSDASLDLTALTLIRRETMTPSTSLRLGARRTRLAACTRSSRSACSP